MRSPPVLRGEGYSTVLGLPPTSGCAAAAMASFASRTPPPPFLLSRGERPPPSREGPRAKGARRPRCARRVPRRGDHVEIRLKFFLPVEQLVVATTLASSVTLLRAAVTLHAVPLTFAVHATLLESGVPPVVVGLWEEAEERCFALPLPTSPLRATVFLVSVSSTTRRPRSPPLGHVCGGVGGLCPWGRSIRERKGRHARPRRRALRWWTGEKA
jgi:hypothetical protein